MTARFMDTVKITSSQTESFTQESYTSDLFYKDLSFATGKVAFKFWNFPLPTLGSLRSENRHCNWFWLTPLKPLR